MYIYWIYTSTLINQANDILYPSPTQISPNSLQNCGQPQYMLQNQTVNRPISSNMNMNSINMNNANNTVNPGFIKMITAQSPTLLTSAQTLNSGGNIATGIMQRLANQNAGQASVYDLIQQMNSQLNIRLSCIEQNMSKLSVIESSISCVKSEMSALKSDNVSIRTNMGEMERFCQSVSGIIDSCTSNNTTTNTHLKNLEQENKLLKTDFKTLKDINADLETKVSSMKEKMLQMEARSMQSNLLFFWTVGVGRKYTK